MNELIPSHSEMALIGSLINEPSRISDVFSSLTPDDFGDEGCKRIARLMVSGVSTDSGIADYMDAAYQYDRTIADYMNSSYNAGAYDELIRTVSDHSRRRNVFFAAQSLLSASQNHEADIDNALQYFMKRTGESAGSSILVESATDIEHQLYANPEVGRLNTGHSYFDTIHYKTGGSRRGQMEYVLAISGHGKSQYIGMLEMLYAKQGLSVLHFQFEDSKYSTYKVLNQYVGVSAQDREALSRVYVSDTCRTIQHIDMAVRRFVAKQPVDVIVVDYVQNVRCVGVNDPRERVSEVSGRLRDMAKDYNCYVIAASQVSRDKTRRGYSAFPQLQDGKESSQIEQDAFMVTAIFRPNMLEELHAGDRRVRNIDGTGAIDWNVVYAKKRKDRSGELDSTPAVFQHSAFGLRVYDPIYDRRTKPTEYQEHQEGVPF